MAQKFPMKAICKRNWLHLRNSTVHLSPQLDFTFNLQFQQLLWMTDNIFHLCRCHCGQVSRGQPVQRCELHALPIRPQSGADGHDRVLQGQGQPPQGSLELLRLLRGRGRGQRNDCRLGDINAAQDITHQRISIL